MEELNPELVPEPQQASPAVLPLANEEWLAELAEMKRRGTPVLNGGDSTVRVLTALFAYQAFAPFWSAFTSELGKQLGETTTQVMHRVRLRLTGKQASVEVQGQEADSATSVKALPTPRRLLVQLDFNPDELSDEARLAMLDIDFVSPYLQGKTLCWSPTAGAWIPVPASRSTGTGDDVQERMP